MPLYQRAPAHPDGVLHTNYLLFILSLANLNTSLELGSVFQEQLIS